MARSNFIIVGSVALAPLILGVESYALYRAHHHRATPADAIEMTAGPAPVAQTPAVPPPAARPLAPPPPMPPAPVAEEPPPETETVSDVQPDPANERRRQLMLQRRGEVLQAADEQVFGPLNLPDAQRAAIRDIDSAYARTLQAIGQLPQGADLQSAGLDPNADQARRAAIANVLGSDATHAFNFAERKAERHVRNQYRPEQVRGR